MREDYTPSEARIERRRLIETMATRIAATAPDARDRCRLTLERLRERWAPVPGDLAKSHGPVTGVGAARAIGQALGDAFPALRLEIADAFEGIALLDLLANRGRFG